MEDKEYDEIPLVPDLLEKIESEAHFTDAISHHLLDEIKDSLKAVYHIASTKGSEHPTALIELQRLVDLYEEAYQYHAAQKLLMRLEVAFSRTYGSENVFMCKVWNKLGELLYREMHYQHAERFYLKSLNLLHLVFTSRAQSALEAIETHEEFIPVLKGLAETCFHLEMLPESETYYTQLIAAFTAQRGAEHEDTLHAINALTLVLEEDDKIDKAVEVGQQSFQNCSAHLGARHPFTQAAASTLARLKEAQGQVHQAEEMYRLAVEYSIDALGEKHAQSLSLQFSLAKLLKKIGANTKSLALIDKLIPLYEETLGEYHEEYLQVLCTRGEVLLLLDEPEAARENFQRCYAHRVMIFTEEHPLSYQALYGVGRAFHAASAWRHRLDYQDNIANAKEMLYKAYCGIQHIYSNTTEFANVYIGMLHPDCVDVSLYYAKFLQQFEFIEEAEAVYSKLFDLVLYLEKIEHKHPHNSPQRSPPSPSKSPSSPMKSISSPSAKSKPSSPSRVNETKDDELHHHLHHHPLTELVRGEVMYNLAVVSERRKKFDKAVLLFEKALQLYDDILEIIPAEHREYKGNEEKQMSHHSNNSNGKEQDRQYILELRADCEEQLHHARTLLNLT